MIYLKQNKKIILKSLARDTCMDEVHYGFFVKNNSLQSGIFIQQCRRNGKTLISSWNIFVEIIFGQI